jgi:hypothetical protein
MPCSWCHTTNDDGVHWCRTCGHAAHLPRRACACDACQTPRRRHGLACAWYGLWTPPERR